MCVKQTDINRLEQAISRIEDKLDEQLKNDHDLVVADTRLEGRIKGLTRTIEVQGEKIQSLATEVASLKGDVADVKAWKGKIIWLVTGLATVIAFATPYVVGFMGG